MPIPLRDMHTLAVRVRDEGRFADELALASYVLILLGRLAERGDEEARSVLSLPDRDTLWVAPDGNRFIEIGRRAVEEACLAPEHKLARCAWWSVANMEAAGLKRVP